MKLLVISLLLFLLGCTFAPSSSMTSNTNAAIPGLAASLDKYSSTQDPKYLHDAITYVMNVNEIDATSDHINPVIRAQKFHAAFLVLHTVEQSIDPNFVTPEMNDSAQLIYPPPPPQTDAERAAKEKQMAYAHQQTTLKWLKGNVEEDILWRLQVAFANSPADKDELRRLAVEAGMNADFQKRMMDRIENPMLRN